MTAQQSIEYARVEFRPNPARPEDDRIFLGIVFAFKRGRQGEIVGWRLLFDVPEEQLDRLDTLSRELVVRRKATLRSELSNAIKQQTDGRKVIKSLAASNAWAFHISAPQSMKVTRYSSARTIEDWVDEWTLQICKGEGAASLDQAHLVTLVEQEALEPA
jgi:hypothetical protein